MRLHRLRRDAHRFAEARFALLRIVQGGERLTKKDVCARVGCIDAQRRFGALSRVIVSSGQEVHRSGTHLRRHIVRLELSEAQHFANCRRRIVRARGDAGELRMGFDRLRCALDGVAIFDRRFLIFPLLRIAVAALDVAAGRRSRIARAGRKQEGGDCRRNNPSHRYSGK